MTDDRVSEPTSDRVPTLESIQAALEAAKATGWVSTQRFLARFTPTAVVTLIANAPSWLAYLLAEREQWRLNALAATELGVEWHLKYDKASAQVDALREALREFAELDSWIGNGVGSTSQEQWVMDTEHRIAERARALLAQETQEETTP